MNWSDEPGRTASGLDEGTFGELLPAAQRGNERAVEWLFVQLQPRLLRFLVAHEPRVADDLAGEVWLAVAERIDRFEGGWSDFRAWFFTIARRRLADHRRTAVRRRTDVVDGAVFEIHPASESTEELVLDSLAGQDAATLITSTFAATKPRCCCSACWVISVSTRSPGSWDARRTGFVSPSIERFARWPRGSGRRLR